MTDKTIEERMTDVKWSISMIALDSTVLGVSIGNLYQAYGRGDYASAAFSGGAALVMGLLAMYNGHKVIDLFRKENKE